MRETHEAGMTAETHSGVSALRRMNAAVLAKQKEIVILHEHADPIAVLIPYGVYMKWQDLYLKLNAASRLED